MLRKAYAAGRLAKGIVTASKPFDRWRAAHRRRVVTTWYRESKPVPPPIDVKHSILLEYARAHDLELFVETGTYWGSTVAAMRPHFRHVLSIELQPRLARHAQRRFAPYRDVTIIHGDTRTVLTDLVPRMEEPTLFWLDAHYSMGVTAPTEPLREELTAVRGAPAGSVVLVDDARCFSGGVRLTLAEIRELAEERFLMEVRDDVIRLTPQRAVRGH